MSRRRQPTRSRFVRRGRRPQRPENGRRKGQPCYTKAAQARSASRWIDAETVRKHGAGLYHFIRGDERSRHIPHHARARIPKPLVLAAFFGYFLSLVTESTPPEAFVEQRAWWGRPLSHGFAVPAPLAQESLWSTDCHTSDIGHWFAMTHYKKLGANPGGGLWGANRAPPVADEAR